jgi:D-glycero-alpha-D-manno-heptose 1-phosphate guanylyltransferase
MIPTPCALILCGGLGTRLRSVVSDRPKSMALIGSRPFLEVQILHLRDCGISRFVLGTGYLAEQVRDHFGDGSAWGVEISYSHEIQPMGTGGAIRLALDQLRDPCLILNGDSFCEFNLETMKSKASASAASMVMLVRLVENAGRYGRVETDATGRITAFHEKSSEEQPGLINAGIYLVRRELIEFIPTGRPVSFEKEIIPAWLGRECQTIESSGEFIDIGVPEDYARAQSMLARLVPSTSH